MQLFSDSHAVLPQLAWAVNSHFQVLLRSERRKTGICSFTAARIRGKPVFQFSSAPRGGKLAIAALPPLSSAVNWIFQFSSAVRGGKLATAALPPLPSAVKSAFQFSTALRGGKLEIAFTLRVLVAEIFQSGFSSSFRFFCLLVAPGVGA